ncbi:hypothetical protein ABBQ32_002812 [Trebouxia sp. C0010 RCD-2024]
MQQEVHADVPVANRAQPHVHGIIADTAVEVHACITTAGGRVVLSGLHTWVCSCEGFWQILLRNTSCSLRFSNMVGDKIPSMVWYCNSVRNWHFYMLAWAFTSAPLHSRLYLLWKHCLAADCRLL